MDERSDGRRDHTVGATEWERGPAPGRRGRPSGASGSGPCGGSVGPVTKPGREGRGGEPLPATKGALGTSSADPSEHQMKGQGIPGLCQLLGRSPLTHRFCTLSIVRIPIPSLYWKRPIDFVSVRDRCYSNFNTKFCPLFVIRPSANIRL